MTTPDPAALARRLSPAQAIALMWLPEDGSAYPTEDMLAAAYRELHNLETFGLVAQVGWRWSITPLGLAVRAELVRQAAVERAGGDGDG